MRQSIAVVCAMESEAAHLRRRLDGVREVPLARWRRACGRLGERDVELVVAGIGLVNAAAATAALCAAGAPRALLNYGCSGAHREDLDPGDVVLASRVVHPTSQIVRRDGAPRYKGFWYEVGGRRVETDALLADPELLAVASRLALEAPLPVWPGVGHAPRVLIGTVASADVWTQHGEAIRALHGLHGSLCEEMEAAAVAQVAAIFGVPFLAIKDISNNELVALTDLDAPDGLTLAPIAHEIGRRAALLVDLVIQAL